MTFSYNGTPRGLKNCKDGGCSRCNNPQSEAFDECLCIHAEENALLEAGRERVDQGSGAVLYCNTCVYYLCLSELDSPSALCASARIIF